MTTKNKFGQLTPAPLRECWKHEETDFTPWLASDDGIKRLGDAIGIELADPRIEVSVGSFRADILCRDTINDELVIIENQLERTDHSHLGQLLTYATGLEAKTIVWVAKSFTDEHRATLDRLNSVSNESMQLFGIEIEVWRIDESRPAPKFNLVCAPNNWSKTAKEAASFNTSEQVFFKYWEGFGIYLENENSTFKKRTPKKRPKGFANFSLGRTDTALTATINNKEFVIKVEFDSPPHPTWFHKLHAQRAELEGKLGFELEWQERPGKRSSEIRVSMPADMRKEEEHPKGYRWMLKHIEAMDRVFRPYIAALDDAPIDDTEPEE